MTTYYVATSGNDSNDGLSPANAWQSLSKVSSGVYYPDDSILFNRGDLFHGSLKMWHSGAKDRPITISSYGAGSKPIITCRDDLLGWNIESNWTDQGGNIWTIEQPGWPGVSGNPHKLWLDGVDTRWALTQAGINSTDRWWWNGGTTLYLFSTSNPATAFTSIQAAVVEQGHSLNINSQSYIDVEGIAFEGGWQCVYIHAETDSTNHIRLIDCEIGKYSKQVGVNAISWQSNHDCDYGEITGCAIDSYNTLQYKTGEYFSEGISLTNASYWKVYNNVIRDWNHSGLGINGDIDKASRYNEVYDNTFTGENSLYFRGFALTGPEGTCSYNHVHRNMVINTTVRNQIAGDHNIIEKNIIANVVNKDNGFTANAQALTLEDISTHDTCHDNQLVGNLIVGTDEEGIRIRENVGGGTPLANNVVEGNYLVDCGRNSEGGVNDIAITVADQANVNNNIIRENMMQKSGVTNLVSYRGTAMSVKVFNSKNGTEGDVITDNL